MPDPAIAHLFGEIKTTVVGIATKDGTAIASFADAQLERLAKHAVLLKKAALAGAFEDVADAEHFADELVVMTRDFVLALGGLALVTIEKIWNAVVKIVWGAINTAMGALGPLPLPQFNP